MRSGSVPDLDGNAVVLGMCHWRRGGEVGKVHIPPSPVIVLLTSLFPLVFPNRCGTIDIQTGSRRRTECIERPQSQNKRSLGWAQQAKEMPNSVATTHSDRRLRLKRPTRQGENSLSPLRLGCKWLAPRHSRVLRMRLHQSSQLLRHLCLQYERRTKRPQTAGRPNPEGRAPPYRWCITKATLRVHPEAMPCSAT